MLVRAWVDGPLAAIALATAAYCVGRLIAAAFLGRRIEYDIDLTHVVMGVSMAGMLVSRLSFIGATVWKAVFTVAAAWYAVRIIVSSLGRQHRSHRMRHYTGHLLSTGVMLYMYVTPTAPANDMNMVMPTLPAGTHPVTLAPVFAMVLFAYSIRVAGRISMAAAPTAHCGGPLAPRAGLTCDAVMSLAMGVMLIIGL